MTPPQRTRRKGRSVVLRRKKRSCRSSELVSSRGVNAKSHEMLSTTTAKRSVIVEGVQGQLPSSVETQPTAIDDDEDNGCDESRSSCDDFVSGCGVDRCGFSPSSPEAQPMASLEVRKRLRDDNDGIVESDECPLFLSCVPAGGVLGNRSLAGLVALVDDDDDDDNDDDDDDAQRAKRARHRGSLGEAQISLALL